jgi:Zn-dependent M32 family carboxypeptidase
MKERIDKMWKGPTQTEMNLLEEYQEDDSDAYQVFYQDFEELDTHSVLQQSFKQLRKDQHSFLNKLAQQMRPTQSSLPTIPEVTQEPTTRDILAQLVGMTKRLEVMEQNQLQTHRAAAANQEDF